MLTDKTLKIGNGYINQVYNVLSENGISGKILYVSDPVVDGIYGDILKKQLRELGTVKEEYVDYNTITYSMNIAERVIATDVSCIVALGGGKVLDVCKYAAYISKCPLLSIPTTMANDGIASPIAVLKRNDDKPKSLSCAMPQMILVDTELIMNSPIQLIKAGIGDTISNHMALIDWEFAVSRGKDTMNGYAYIMSQTALDALLKTQYDSICPEFVGVLANCLVMSGLSMDFAGSSRPSSGSEHLFSHALDYYSDVKNLHGIQVALGTVSVLKLLDMNYEFVLNCLKKFEVNVNPQHLGIDEDTFVTCLQNATSIRKNRYTHLHEADLSAPRLKKLYKELLVEV